MRVPLGSSSLIRHVIWALVLGRERLEYGVVPAKHGGEGGLGDRREEGDDLRRASLPTHLGLDRGELPDRKRAFPSRVALS